MIIQSKKVWIADQFTPAQLELEDGIIKETTPLISNKNSIYLTSKLVYN